MKCQWCGKEFTPQKVGRNIARQPAVQLPIGNDCPRMKYIRRKPYSFVHFGACSAGKWSMSMIHPITVSNFAVSIVRNCTGNIRKRKGKKAFDNSSATLVEKTSLSQTLWTGGVSIAVRPVGKPSTKPNEKRFEQKSIKGLAARDWELGKV